MNRILKKEIEKYYAMKHDEQVILELIKGTKKELSYYEDKLENEIKEFERIGLVVFKEAERLKIVSKGIGEDFKP